MTRNDRIAYLRKEVEYLRQASVHQLNLADIWNTRDPSLFPAAPGMVDDALRKSERYAERAQVLEETLDEHHTLVGSLAETIEENRHLREALEKIRDFAPVVYTPSEELKAAANNCKECKCEKNPANLCDRHYALFHKLVWSPTEHARNAQHSHMRDIAQKVLEA